MTEPSPTLDLRVDTASELAPYEQLRRQLGAQVEDGVLPAGTRLPPVRALAAQLGLAPGTVARAYRELEADGVLDTRGRAGTFVAGDGVEAEARAAARAFAARMAELGVPPHRAVALAELALRDRS